MRVNDLSYVPLCSRPFQLGEADMESSSETYEICECDQHEFSSRPNMKVIRFDRESVVGTRRDRKFEISVRCIELLVIESESRSIQQESARRFS